jgi:hypothetical protein
MSIPQSGMSKIENGKWTAIERVPAFYSLLLYCSIALRRAIGAALVGPAGLEPATNGL